MEQTTLILAGIVGYYYLVGALHLVYYILFGTDREWTVLALFVLCVLPFGWPILCVFTLAKGPNSRRSLLKLYLLEFNREHFILDGD